MQTPLEQRYGRIGQVQFVNREMQKVKFICDVLIHLIIIYQVFKIGHMVIKCDSNVLHKTVQFQSANFSFSILLYRHFYSKGTTLLVSIFFFLGGGGQ